MGRFDDSIAQYRKALEIDSNFVNAHQGIAMDLLYSGRPAEAEAELSNITKKARTDGERRTALFALSTITTLLASRGRRKTSRRQRARRTYSGRAQRPRRTRPR